VELKSILNRRLIVGGILLAAFVQPSNSQDSREARVARNLKDSKIVVIAEVVRLGPTYGFWIGILPSYQYAYYKVGEVTKGHLSEREITCRHLVVHNSETADKNEPRLSPTLFAKGNKVVLFLRGSILSKDDFGEIKPGDKIYETLDENFGVIPATEEILNMIKKR
jgi:hypothetical protein